MRWAERVASSALFRLLGRRLSRVAGGGFFRFSRVIAFGSVFLGSMALMLALAILEGFQRTLYEQSLRFTWHVQVRTFGGRPFFYEPVVERLQREFPGATVAAVREQEALLRTAAGVEGVVLRALSLAPSHVPVGFQIAAGRGDFSSDTASEVLVGQALARRLELAPGDTVLVITAQRQGGNVLPLLKQLKVVGLYRSGLTKYEELYAYLPFGRAGRLWEVPELAATGVDLLLPTAEVIREAPQRIEQLLGVPFYALSLYELHQPLFAWIELQRVPIPLVLGLMTLVAVFNVLTFLVLLVVEKARSFAILQVLGLSPRQIRWFLVWQGVGLSFTGAAAGCAVAGAFAWVQTQWGIIRLEGALYYLDTLPIAVLWWQPIVVIAAAVGLAVLASVVPSAVARRLPVVALLHFR
ncbi:MAG: FtsX-like permease family protein [Chlorobiota bacterium]